MPKWQYIASIFLYFQIVYGEFFDTACVRSARSDRESTVFVIYVKISSKHDAPSVISGDGALMEIAQLICKLDAVSSQVILNVIETVN